ncbi:Ubiquitin carboxyl-terminal hydrolase 12 [Haplosporangium sp. Z 27]|nr:Ubiquitin carboxyl-terminal hydrolase 12 [Haplosporangium sp. Z 27]
MAEPIKLAQRMKLNDGSIAPVLKKNSGSRKRKGTSKRGERYGAFSGYGTDAESGDLQDENQDTSLSIKGATDSKRRNPPAGPPPTKKHKQPQQTPPINSALLHYFNRVPLGNQDSSRQNSSVHTLETQQSMKTFFGNITHKSNPVQSASAHNASGCSKESLHDQLKESKRAATSKCSSDKAPSVEVYEDNIIVPTEPAPAKASSSAKPKVNGEIKVKADEAKLKKKDSASRLLTSKPKALVESDSINAPDEKPAAEDIDQPKSNRSVLDFFKYQPKSTSILPEVTQLSVRSINDSESTVIEIQDSSEETFLDKTSNPESIKQDKITITALVETNASEGATISEGNTISEGIIISREQELDQDQVIKAGEESSQQRSPRRCRLVRASDMKPKNYCESSEDASDEDVDPKPRRSSKESKKTRLRSSPRQSKSGLLPSLEQEREQESELDPGPEPEPEPELRHITASKQFMRSYFGVPTPISSSLTSTLSRLAKESEDSSQSVEPIQDQLPVARPVLKTYSKAKSSRASSKKKSKAKSAFTDSEKSGSDLDSNGSDDDLSDFVEKPDPNQKSITDMFSKSLPRSASSYTPIIRPRTKRKLTPASQSILSGGLSNISNTCYLNSVLQTLRNTDDCAQSLFAIKEKMETLEKSQQLQINVTEYQRSLFDHALEIFRTLDLREKGDAGNEQDEKSIYPTKIIRTLRQGDSLFNSSEQQDAAEFLFYVISQFDDILKAVIQMAEKSGTETLIPREWQPINDLFQVGTQSVTHCQRCPSVSVNVDRSIDLTVQIDAESPTVIRDLDWGITATMNMEHMKDENQRFCEKCNSKEDAYVYHYFTSLPKIMILRLQRYNFKEGAIKIQNGVSCSEKLCFAKWMSQDYKGPNLNYELCAIIVHRGRVITSGHYFVYIKKDVEIETEITEPDGETRTEKKAFRWLKYNDSCVDPTSDEDMARVFSGNSQSNNIEKVSNTSDHAVESLEHSKKTVFTSTNIFDDDMATPYVYIYRRIDDL